MIRDKHRRLVQGALKRGDLATAMMETSKFRRIRPDTAVMQCLAYAHGEAPKTLISSLRMANDKMPRMSQRDEPVWRSIAGLSAVDSGCVAHAERHLAKLSHYGAVISEWGILRLLYEATGRKPPRLLHHIEGGYNG